GETSAPPSALRTALGQIQLVRVLAGCGITSCWLLPQNVQWSGFLVSPPLTLLISDPGQDTSHHSRYPTGQSGRTHDREGEHAPMRRRRKVSAPRLINYRGSS